MASIHLRAVLLGALRYTAMMNFTATLPQERLAKHFLEWSLVPLTLPLIARHRYLIYQQPGAYRT
jgi:hypothetical protein